MFMFVAAGFLVAFLFGSFKLCFAFVFSRSRKGVFVALSLSDSPAMRFLGFSDTED